MLMAGFVTSAGGKDLVRVDPGDRLAAVFSDAVVRVEEGPGDWVRAYDTDGDWAGAAWEYQQCYQLALYVHGPGGRTCVHWARQAILDAARAHRVPVYGVPGLW